MSKNYFKTKGNLIEANYKLNSPKPNIRLLFAAIFSFSAIILQAQPINKTLKLFAPPNGNATADSLLLWRASDSSIRKAPVGSLYWSVAGNSGTVAGTNFIGTTDSVDWLVKTNNTEKMRILADGKVGINTATPQTTLDVTGNPTNASSPDGIKAPLITLAQLNLKTGYGTNQTSALIYVTDITGGSTVAATANVAAVGYYYWDGTAWQLIPRPTGAAMFSASLGTPGSPTTTSATIPANNQFNTVPLSTVVYTLGGGVWDPTTYTYTVPITGTYLLKATLRIVDSTLTPRDVFMAIGPNNADQTFGIWQQYPAPGTGHIRWTMLYNRIAYLTAGTGIRLFTYSDNNVFPITYATMDIMFLSQIGSAGGN